MNTNKFENATPNPEYLIKSIAERGYSLETALAHLMDNSISAKANKIEVLIDIQNEPFTLFLADNGNGMKMNSNYQFNFQVAPQIIKEEMMIWVVSS